MSEKRSNIMVTSDGLKDTLVFKDLKSACDYYGFNHSYLLGKIPKDGIKYYKGYRIKKIELK